MKPFSTFVTKYAKIILSLWLILFVIMALFAIQLPAKLEGDGFFTKEDYHHVTSQLADNFNIPEETIFVLFKNKSTEEIDQTLKKLDEQLDDIQSITSPIEIDSLNKDGYSYAILNLIKDIDSSKTVDELRQLLKKEDGISITGAPAIRDDMRVASQKDLASAEAIGLPIALIVLLLAFGTIVSAVLPIIVGAVSIVIALGILTLLGDTIDLSIFILNITPMIGLALSIDFALLFINRYREERQNFSIEEAIQKTIQTAGRSIIFSAICVMIGLGAMVLIKVEIFQNIALGGTIAVLFSVLGGITLLPSLLMLLGDRIEKGKILRVRPVATRWQSFASFVMKHPVKIIILSIVILVVGMIPIKDMKLTIPSADALPTSYESRATYDQLRETFDFNKNAIVYLLAENEQGWDNEKELQKILDIQKKLQEDDLVKEVSSLFTAAQMDSIEMWKFASNNPQTKQQLQQIKNYFIDGKQMYMTITLNADSNSKKAQNWVRKWKDEDLGVSFKLGGQPKFNQEIFDEIFNKLPYSTMIIIISTFVILLIAFRSILIPLKAIIMNILGLGAAFGILVYLFQYGHFGLYAGSISLIIPVIVFCLVFGLSMDYEVFLISRIQEEYRKERNNTKATIDGLVMTSKIITSAALIMIVITGSFIFTDVMPVKQIGVGIAIAVFIDVTIIRLMLVPSLMKLFGHWNWWLPFKKLKTRGN